jgi:hypothetical protein
MKVQQAIESQTKAKSKITWRRPVSDPLGKGNGLTHPRQSKAQAKSANHRNKARTTTKSSPCTHASSPWTNAPPPGRMHANQLKTVQLQQLQLTPVRPVHNRAQKWLETTWKPSKCVQQTISSSNFSPLLAMHESSQKCKKFNLELFK